MSIHPNDILAAIEWALNKAREAAKTDELVRLNILPALESERERAQRESRNG